MKFKAQIKKLKQEIDQAARSAPMGVEPPEFGCFDEDNPPSAEWLAKDKAYDHALRRRGIDPDTMGPSGIFFEVISREKYPDGSTMPDGTIAKWPDWDELMRQGRINRGEEVSNEGGTNP